LDNTTSTIIIGIVTGLLTASLLLIIKSLFINSFLPWYQQTMYKGILLNGSWYSYLDNQKILLEITHKCESIIGKATVQLTQENIHIDDIRTFDVTGRIEGRFITLKMHHTNKARLGIVTYLLQVDGDGTKLRGQSCWYAPLASKISSGEITLFRNEEIAKKDKEQKDIKNKMIANKTLDDE